LPGALWAAPTEREGRSVSRRTWYIAVAAIGMIVLLYVFGVLGGR
jgi:hypothetical protein